MVSADSEGNLLVCPGKGQSVFLGGGMSERFEALQAKNNALEAEIARLRSSRKESWNPLDGVVPVSTVGANDWTHFEIGGDHFLVVADYYGPGNSLRGQSHLYKYDQSNGKFDFKAPWQSVTTYGATDWEHFEIAGDHFLAITNRYTGSTYNTASHIYKYDNDTGKFDFGTPWQSVTTNGARDWEHFNIGDDHFLAVANQYNGATYNIKSQIYKYDSNTRKFNFGNPWQSITTNGALDWKHFEIAGDHFLAVANFFTGSSHSINSYIFKYDSNTGKFDIGNPWQSVTTYGAVDWEYFEIAGDHFLAVGNQFTGSTYNTNSHIYKYDNNTGKFDIGNPWQSIATDGVYCLQHFEVMGDHFLAVANYRSGSALTIESHIYKYSSNTELFNTLLPFKSVTLTSAVDWEVFIIGSRIFLAAACGTTSYVFVSDLP